MAAGPLQTLQMTLQGARAGLRIARQMGKGDMVPVAGATADVTARVMAQVVNNVPVIGGPQNSPAARLPGAGMVPSDWANSWLGPGQPLTPLLTSYREQARELEPRTMSYPPNVNATIAPRLGYGLMGFAELLRLAESVPEAALCVRLLTEEMKTFVPQITGPNGEPIDNEDPHWEQIKWMLRKPDGKFPWPVWLSRLIANILIYDAPALYNIRDGQGYLRGMRVLDGSTIFALVDENGETPSAPAPGFVSVIWGIPRMYLNTKQLWYVPRAPRTDAPYGKSFIEDSLQAVRWLEQHWLYSIAEWTEGNMPEMMVPAPPNWTNEQILVWEDAFNAVMAGNVMLKKRVRFIPSGMGSPIQKDIKWDGAQYGVALERVAFAAGIPGSELGKTPGQGLGGKGFSDKMESAFFRMGIQPLKTFIEQPFNEHLDVEYGLADKGYTWELVLPPDTMDPEKEHETTLTDWGAGLIRRNEARAPLGYDPDPSDQGNDYFTPGPGQPGGPGSPDGSPAGGGGARSWAGVGVKRQTAKTKASMKLGVGRPVTVKVIDSRKLAKADVQHDGSMVALMVPARVADQLVAIRDQLSLPKDAKLEKPESMHVTLAYFPEQPLGRDALNVMGAMQASAFEFGRDAISGLVQGFGVFEQPDGGSVLWANLDATGLNGLRATLCDQLDRRGVEYGRDHDFTPHITLAYLPAGYTLPALPTGSGDVEPVLIDALTYAYQGDNYVSITLGEGYTRLGKVRMPPELVKSKKKELTPQPPALAGEPLPGLAKTVDMLEDGTYPNAELAPVGGPPNLRVAANGASELCETCASFTGGKCAMYNLCPVMPYQVCNSWQRSAPTDVAGLAKVMGGLVQLHVDAGVLASTPAPIVVADALDKLADALTPVVANWRTEIENLRKEEPATALYKHCGVCEDDEQYYGQPVSQGAEVDFPVQGANHSQIVTIHPDGLEPRPAIFKPEEGESEKLQARVGGVQGPREEAAYLLSRSLSFDLVPVSFVTEVNGTKGSVQHYVQGRQKALDVSAYADEWVQRAAVFDYITQQSDRRSANWLTHPEEDGRMVLPDNGLSFPDNAVITDDPFIEAWGDKPLDQGVLDALHIAVGDEAMWADVKDLVGKGPAQAARTRTRALLEAKRIPAVTGAPEPTDGIPVNKEN